MQNSFALRNVIFGKNTKLLFPTLWSTDSIYSSSTTLVDNELLSPNHRAIFDTTGITLDGGGYKFQMSVTQTSQLYVNSNVAVTIKNIWIENLNYPTHISLASGASITWGDGTSMALYQDQVLTSTITTSGAVTIYGEQNILDLSSAGFTITSGSTLKLSNLTIKNVSSSSFSLASNTSSIIFENVKVNMTPGNTFAFPIGWMLFRGNIEFSGKGSVFAYSTTATSSIDSGATLKFSDGSIFIYNPANHPVHGIPSQVNLIMVDKSSKLSLNGCDWQIRGGGMQIKKGIIEVNRRNNIYIDAASITNTSKGLILGDGTFANNVSFLYGPGGKFSVESGVLNYKNLEATPINYGDAISIKHSEYGFYISASSAAYTATKKYATGLVTSPTNNTRWYLQPGPYRRYDGTVNSSATNFINDRWGNGHSGQPVKSGDYIKLESYNFTISSNRINFTYEFGTAPLASTPNPPYYMPTVTQQSQTSNTNGDWFFIIIKKGGYFGDPILKGDEFYLMGVNQGAATFLGSINNTISTGSYGDGSGSVVKEIYFYRVSTTLTNPVFPANFGRDFIWTCDDIIAGAYSTAPSGYSSTAEFAMPTYSDTGRSKINLREFKIL